MNAQAIPISSYRSSSQCETKRKKGGFFKFTLFVVFVLVAGTLVSNSDLYLAELMIYNAEATVAVAVPDGTQHAIEKHGAEAEMVLQCSNSKKPLQIWTKGDRKAIVICMDDGRYALHIKCGERTVTAFIKDKMKRLEQVMQYLENRLYMRIL